MVAWLVRGTRQATLGGVRGFGRVSVKQAKDLPTDPGKTLKDWPCDRPEGQAAPQNNGRKTDKHTRQASNVYKFLGVPRLEREVTTCARDPYEWAIQLPSQLPTPCDHSL